MTTALRTLPQSPTGRYLAVGLVALCLAIVSSISLAVIGMPLPLLALIAAMSAWVLFARPDTATLSFAFILYVNLPVIAADFHGVPEPIAILTPLLLGIPLLVYLVVRREPVILTPALGLMVAYLAVLLVSSAFSQDPDTGAQSVVTYVTEGMILAGLVANAIRSIATLRNVLIVLVIAGAFMGGLSIFQEATGTYRNAYGGFAQTLYTPGSEEAQAAELDENARPRLAGPIGSKNRYAQIMVVLLPFAFMVHRLGRHRIVRWAAIVAGMLILGGILLTFSRGAGVAIAGLVGVMVMLRILPLTRVLLVIPIMIGVTLLVAPDYVARIESVGDLLTDTENVDNAVLGRATSNLAAIQAFVDHPILGVGPGSYATNYSQEYANELGLRHFDSNRRAHNLYLEIAADTGVFGILIFMGILGITMLQLWRLRSALRARHPELSEIATALFLALVGYAFTGVFLHLAYARYFWFLIAVANAGIWLLHRELRRGEEPDPREAIAAG